MAKKKRADKPAKTRVAIEDVEFDIAASQDDDDEAPRKSSVRRGGGSNGSVYKIIEVVGASPKSWEHAAQVAVSRASQTLEDLRVAEVVDQDIKIEDGKIASYRTKLRLSFKFRD